MCIYLQKREDVDPGGFAVPAARPPQAIGQGPAISVDADRQAKAPKRRKTEPAREILSSQSQVACYCPAEIFEDSTPFTCPHLTYPWMMPGISCLKYCHAIYILSSVI